MLDWEEKVFLGLKAVYHRLRVRPEQLRREGRRATLRERRGCLLFLGQLVAGRAVVLFETEKAALCSADRIFLPTEFSAAPDPAANHALYDLKVILAALAIRDGWDSSARLPEKIATLAEEFPGLGGMADGLARALAPASLWDILGAPLPERVSPATGETSPPPGHRDDPENPAAITEIEGKGQAEAEVSEAPPDDGDGADMPMHTFEKVETLEEANGLSRKTDAEDELEEHQEALDKLEMTHVVRSSERPSSVYRGDLILDGFGLEVADASSGGLPYPEWDFKRRSYRPAWCHVKVERHLAADPAWERKTAGRHHGLIRQLKRQFASVVTEWRKTRRQTSGSEFDLDALVQAETDRRSGHTPSEAIYADRQRDLHDVAALVLLDQSYSTDSWVEDQRVLDVITESIYCAGEVFQDYLHTFAVASFSSNTRRSCHFSLLKDFGDDWMSSRARLGTLTPCGYTRIGPALRHSQELLKRRSARRKIIILLTDGHPCDYDRYEGEHGIHDVKKAIETGRLDNIATHALAIEKDAAAYFPRMFAGHRYDIVPRPQALARSLCRLFAKTVTG